MRLVSTSIDPWAAWAVQRPVIFGTDEAVVFQVQWGDLIAFCIVFDHSVDVPGTFGRGVCAAAAAVGENLLQQWCQHEDVEGNEVDGPRRDSGRTRNSHFICVYMYMYIYIN